MSQNSNESGGNSILQTLDEFEHANDHVWTRVEKNSNKPVSIELTIVCIIDNAAVITKSVEKKH